MALPNDWEGSFSQHNILTAARMRCPHCENATTFAVLFNFTEAASAQLLIVPTSPF
jgi:hypothetical protein